MDLLKNLDNMITAEEFYKQTTGCVINHVDIKNAMIEFAKLHVEAALTEASKVARWSEQITMQGLQVTIIKSSVLNAYSPENIK